MMNLNNENIKKRENAISTNVDGGIFEIHVKGQLDESWTDWLDGLEVKLIDNGEMKLIGYIGDQAALMGILNKLYGLNLALLSVSLVKQNQELQK